ncbi:MAG: DUF2971 domain-containing protein [Hymenobacter sp.]|nr:MAG: DUF2971 domain-containing protein [Hymenobacter sp.]
MGDIKTWLQNVGVAPAFIEDFATQLKQNPDIMREKTEHAMSRLGICCFSTLEDNILQWSHYADYHRGICLKFDITEAADFFRTPIIVAYRKVMQHYNHFTMSKSIVEYLIKPKYADWSYESEVRVVKHSDTEEAGNRAYSFPDSALKEIIFGAKTPDAVIVKYKQLCSTSNKAHVLFSKMSLGSGTHYELIKSPI